MSTLGELGEAGILARILPILSGAANTERTLIGPGDDAALLAVPSGSVVITTDTMIEGKDFLLRGDAPGRSPLGSTGEEIGHKLAVQNLADVAAMGAEPTALVLSLSAPATTPLALIEGIARGLAARSARAGAVVIGGDLGGADMISLTVTAFGELVPGLGGRAIRRDGARVGDVVAVGTPQLGRSAAGLALLLGGHDPAELGDVQRGAEGALEFHRAPEVDLEAGHRLAAALGHDLHAMIDVSDGLLRDAGRLADASGVRIHLDADGLATMAEALRPLADSLGQDPSAWVLGSGEEHAMLICLPPSALQAARDVLRDAGGDLTMVGRVLPAGEEDPRATAAGVNEQGADGSALGWDHFE
ncbi:thiamine-phosphate kinase [Helcobacillus massiliensis]|uniref:thiamine-phosphate kinase n=1 Tax=Helcobacillus massiliensis TaxID=521392 RepID=UPI00255325CA|nr:thiamine-phosphate kinase [Helcobacillus massiliensis]MDK7742127.1 thiamine-phosphate kinase [Helcobacillus massiliensis]WOO93682.1 thiamine-phosphate kinase [Helcobacillus massiliensis]